VRFYTVWVKTGRSGLLLKAAALLTKAASLRCGVESPRSAKCGHRGGCILEEMHTSPGYFTTWSREYEELPLPRHAPKRSRVQSGKTELRTQRQVFHGLRCQNLVRTGFAHDPRGDMDSNST